MRENKITMTNIEYELCEVDGEIELCDNTFPELNIDSIPELN